MSAIHYAFEVDTESTYDDATIGISVGHMRYVTDRPVYNGTETGASQIPIGDNSVVKVTAIVAQTFSFANETGVLFLASNGIFKSASTRLKFGQRFTVLDATDFSTGDLFAAKGSVAPAEGDMFEITDTTTGAWKTKYVGVNKWFEGFITKDGLSNPSRRVDLAGTGDYGTLSGFKAQIKNSIVAGVDTPIWKTLDTNDVFLGNKVIKVYAVIDNLFYQIWQGVIDNSPRTETDFTFVCKANFKRIHVNFPPEAIDDNNFENAIDDVKGSSIPVSIGDIEFAKVFNVTGPPVYVDLVDVSQNLYKNAMATSMGIGVGNATISLQTQGIIFGVNDLQDKYVVVSSGGDNGSLFNIDIDTTLNEDLDTAMSTGQVFKLSNGSKKSANTKLRVDDRFTITTSDDFDSGELQTASTAGGGGSLGAGDVFQITGDSPFTVDYKFTNRAFGDDGLPDVGRAIKIISNLSTTANSTFLNIEEPITNYVETLFGFSGSEPIEDRYQFKVATLASTGIISNKKIKQFRKDINGQHQLFNYNNNLDSYENVRSILEEVDVENTAAEFNNTATVSLLSTNIDETATIDYIFPISSIIGNLQVSGISSTTGAKEIVADFDRSTFVSMVPATTIATMDLIMKIDISENVIDFEELYLGVDLFHDANGGTSNFRVSLLFRDQYGNDAARQDMDYPDPSSTTVFTTITDFNEIPNAYYRAATGNGDNGETSRFASNDGQPAGLIKRLIKVDTKFYNAIRSNVFSNVVRVSIQNRFSGGSAPREVRIKQVAFFGTRVFDVSNANIYSRIQGEFFGASTETNTVDITFRHMLETYNGIDPDLLDFTNLGTARNNWFVGRQVTDKKNMFDYIKDFAKNTFVAVFQNRVGKLALTAWRDRTDTPHAHTGSAPANIVRDSIKKWKLTGVDKIFNNFNLFYAFNPGANDWFRQWQIKDVDDPAERINNDINVRVLWDVCEAAFTNYGVIKEFKMEMPWFNDRSRVFQEGGVAGLGTDGSAFFFLQEAVFYLTRQKRNVEHNIPINSTNVLIELCDPTTFQDPIYTNNEVLAGHIDFIEYDIKNDEIKVGKILDPQDTIDDDFGCIQETGSAPDTITESGSQPDTITETGTA